MNQKDFYTLEAAPVDEKTKLAIELAQDQIQRGEVITLDESEKNFKERYEAWLKAKQEVLTR